MDNLYGSWGNGVEAYLKKDYSAAERHFKSSSPSSKVCFNLGMARLVQFKWQAAIEAFNQALEFDDWMAISYFQRGNAYFMMGNYDEAMSSWDLAKENIRHGEVVDYDSLHLSYMLCKSEIAVNKAIALYYADMTDECNALLDEARGYSIVKDDIEAITQQMIAGADVYPCTVDDTVLFNPPKLPQSVIDAMKKMNGSSSSSPNSSYGSSATSSPPAPSSPPPAYSSAPTVPPPKFGPPSRTAPTAPKKSAGSGPPPPPPKTAKKPAGPPAKKWGGTKTPAPTPASNPRPISPSPVYSPPADSYSSTPAVSSSPPAFGAPPPAPPIPKGGIPKKAISSTSTSNPSSISSSKVESISTQSSGGFAGLKDMIAKRNAANAAKSPSTVSSSPPTTSSGYVPPLPSKIAVPSSVTTSGPTAISPRSAPASGTGFAFKVLAEQGVKKKKIETTVSTPVQLKTSILDNFGAPANAVVEYYDPEFEEFVALDGSVNLSGLPLTLKARICV